VNQRSIQEELAYLPTVYAFVQGSFTFLRLLAHYGQGVNQKTYLTETLAGNIQAILSRPKLDLGTDPLAVSNSLFSSMIACSDILTLESDLSKRNLEGRNGYWCSFSSTERSRLQGSDR